MPEERRTRRGRSERTESRRHRVILAAGAALLGVSAMAGAFVVATMGGQTGATSPSARQADLGGLATLAGNGPASSTSAPATLDTSATASIEVPELVGKTFTEATSLLESLGLSADIRAALSLDDTVAVQAPDAGSVVPQGASVVLSAESVLGTSSRATRALAVLDGQTAVVATTAEAPRDLSAGGYVVVIDPGHQSKGDATHEPVGPGATETKPRVTGGTSGVVTRVPEYEVVLQISMNLKAVLERSGVTVVMTRTTNDVNLSNSERAEIANAVQADLFVRIHADGSTDPGVAGISTLYPGENRWTGPIAGPSKGAAVFVQEAAVAATGASSRGTIARTDLSGFNWSRVPSVLVECGFMSNAVEDRLLSSPHYQDKLAEGMAAGILGYLESSR